MACHGKFKALQNGTREAVKTRPIAEASTAKTDYFASDHLKTKLGFGLHYEQGKESSSLHLKFNNV